MRTTLVKRGFLSLLVTQFFGAVNDNLLKGVLIFMVVDQGIWSGQLGAGGAGIVGVCFTLPFILLSGYGGQFADRNSKRTVAVLVKIIEIPIAITALIGFWTSNLWMTIGALVALACQSAYFGPAKYGMIPELVGDAELSRANGTINMMTNIAVIFGTLAAGAVSDAYNPLVDAATGVRPPGVLWLPGLALILIAGAGLASVVFLPRLPAGDRDLTYDFNPLGTYVTALKEMRQSPLLLVALAWGYFYLLAGFGLLILPEYTMVLKSDDRTQATLLLGVLGVAIGIGSVTAGFISGRRIEPRLIPIGAVGMSVFFLLLGTVPPTFVNSVCFIGGAGFFAGFYIIPFQALLQHLSPEAERGRFLGTANGISFTFLATASALYWMIRPSFGDEPQRIFLVCAGLMICGSAFFLVRLRRALADYL